MLGQRTLPLTKALPTEKYETAISYLKSVLNTKSRIRQSKVPCNQTVAAHVLSASGYQQSSSGEGRGWPALPALCHLPSGRHWQKS